MSIEEWWNKVKDSGVWSGAIVNLTWDQLWDEIKEEIIKIYNLAH